jgi:hypothetical protein
MSILIIAPLIVAFLAILLGAHYFLYRTLMRFFHFSKPIFKRIFFVLILLLSLGFIAASIIVHFNEGFWTKFLYLISAIWLGLFVNLFLACCLIWLIVGIARLFKIRVVFSIVSFIIFVLAIGYSVYGSWNAFNPIIKNISVEIKNLPEQWRGKTIVQLSDIHLGHINGLDFLNDIVNKTNTLNPDLILITGDLFDGMDGNLDYFIDSLKRFQSKNGVFFVIGNHETYLGLEGSLGVLEKSGIKALRNEMVNIDGLQIIGLDDVALDRDSDLIKEIANFDKNQASILMYHTPINVEMIKNSGVNLQLSGHTHKGQLFPLGFITSLAHRGYDYGLFTEGDFSIYITSGVGTWGPPMRTGNHPEIVNITIK